MPRKKVAGSRPRLQMNLKVTPEFRAKLQKSADAAQRSLTGQIEHLVAQGMESEEARLDPNTEMMLRSFSSVIFMIENLLGKKWLDSPELKAAVYLAIECLAQYWTDMKQEERYAYNSRNNGFGASMAAIWASQTLGVSREEFNKRIDGINQPGGLMGLGMIDAAFPPKDGGGIYSGMPKSDIMREPSEDKEPDSTAEPPKPKRSRK